MVKIKIQTKPNLLSSQQNRNILVDLVRLRSGSDLQPEDILESSRGKAEKLNLLLAGIFLE